MSNPFDLLGNDVEDASVDPVVPREVVKKSTSSKKTDTPPASANKDRANKNRPQPTGNDAALKDKSAGRASNKARGVEDPKSASKKPVKGGPKDRQSRTGKVDSDKKIKQAGWVAEGETELENEIEGAEDAAAELEEDSEPKVVKKSFEDYLKEQEQSAFVSQRSSRKVEQVDDSDIIVKEQESFIVPTKAKNLKSKTLKTKNILDFDATFSDELPSESSSRGRGAPRGTRGGAPRGGARGGNTRGRGAPRGGARAPRGGKAPEATKGPKIDDEESFPSLA